MPYPGAVDPPVAMTIAGSDSGGGAGLQADLKTFAALGVFGTMALTAVTAQDTLKVHGVVELAPEFVDAQIDAVLGDLPVRAVKTGMLATIGVIDVVARRAERGELPRLVVDPVMVASSGASLFAGDAPSAYRRLLPHALVVTPNLPEASALLGREIRDLEAMADAARELVALGAKVAVVKGGHLGGERAVDVVADRDQLLELSDEMVDTANVHGTGCTLSAAIAARLALGDQPIAAVRAAKGYVAEVIRASRAMQLGAGPGPLEHLAPLRGPRAGEG